MTETEPQAQHMHPAAEEAGRTEQVPGQASAGISLEWVLRSLLRVRSEPETAAVAVDLMRAASGAAWTALYASGEEGDYELIARSPGETPTLPESVLADTVSAALRRSRYPVVCDERRSIRTMLANDATVLAPLLARADAHGFIALGPIGREPDQEAISLIHRIADATAIALQNARLVEGLRSKVYVDFLTGCQNRRGFDARMTVEVGRARRYDRPVSLLLLDVDRFKWINDSMGHPTGDYALRRLGDFLLSSFRTTDCISRFGGDEFAIIFPETPKEEAERMAEDLRLKIAGLFPDDVMRRGITVSLGVGAIPDDAATAEDLLQAADRALYRAKGAGRNRLVTA